MRGKLTGWTLVLLLVGSGSVPAAAAVRRIPRHKPRIGEQEAPTFRPRGRLLCREEIEALIRAQHGELTAPIVLRGLGRLSGFEDCPCVEYQTRDAFGRWVRGHIDTRIEGSPLAINDRARIQVDR